MGGYLRGAFGDFWGALGERWGSSWGHGVPKGPPLEALGGLREVRGAPARALQVKRRTKDQELGLGV